jgi:hypothetical protein
MPIPYLSSTVVIALIPNTYYLLHTATDNKYSQLLPHFKKYKLYKRFLIYYTLPLILYVT